MRLNHFPSLLLLLMSLLAPHAWGESDGISSWRSRLQGECSDYYGRRLEAWTGISASNRVKLAQALCADDRIFWPFALEAQPQLAPVLEEKFRKPHSQLPLLVGIIGPSPRENSEALHAVRELLFHPSDTLFRWTSNRKAMRTWQRSMTGGLLGGVVFIDFEGAKADLNFHVNRTLAALNHMTENGMESYVLAIQSREDVSRFFPDLNVHWVRFDQSAACADWLRN